MKYNTDPIYLEGMSFEQVLEIAKRMYMPMESRWLSGIDTFEALANKLEADALSISRWKLDEEGFSVIPACVTCGRLLEFAHRVRGLVL